MISKLIFNQNVSQAVCDSVYMQYQLTDTAKPLIITFEAMCSGIKPQEFEQWNGSIGTFKFIKKLGYNVISFIHMENTYYRSSEFVEFIKLLSKELQIFRSKIGYGISLGAFAAAIHANNLKLDTCLLLMPQSTFSDKIAPWESKSKLASIHEDWDNNYYSDAALCNVPVTIIYDPLYPCDVSHVQRFSCPINHVHLYGVGHRIPRALNHLGILSNVVNSFISTGKVPSDYYSLIRKRKYLKYYLKHQLKNPTKKSSLKRRLIFLKLYIKLSLTRKFLAT